MHCDIKPDNIRLTSAGTVKILDFGIARRFSSRRGFDETLSATSHFGNRISCTPEYASPEIFHEQAPDGKSDIFSMGTVFYEMLSGAHPFRASTLMETARRILDHLPTKLRAITAELPEEVENIIFACLEKNRDRRPDSATLLARLRSVGRHPGTAG